MVTSVDGARNRDCMCWRGPSEVHSTIDPHSHLTLSVCKAPVFAYHRWYSYPRLKTATPEYLVCLLSAPNNVCAESECNSSEVSASIGRKGRCSDTRVSTARGLHHQRHLAVGVRSLIKPIKPSHLRTAVSGPRIVQI